MRKTEGQERTVKKIISTYTIFDTSEKVNNLRDVFTVSNKKGLNTLPHPSPRALKSGCKFVSLSVCLSEKGPRKHRNIKKIHHLPRSLMAHIIDVSEI